jgi:hypothetical protein
MIIIDSPKFPLKSMAIEWIADVKGSTKKV